MDDASYVCTPGDGANRALVGGKAGALATLHGTGLPVPAWFALTPRAFVDSLPAAQQTALDEGRLDDDALASLAPSEAVVRAVRDALAVLADAGAGGPLRVAVRSSAVDEDGAAHSFAGQLESYLHVAPGDVPARIADVWRSAFAERVRAYRRARTLPPHPEPPAVLVQRMVEADCAGVAFSVDPVTGRRGTALVSAVRGLGSALVQDEAEGDTYRVDRTGAVTERTVVRQTTAHRYDAEVGTVRPAPLLPGAAKAPVLTDAAARRVAALARAVERHAGTPQDIEWAIAGDALYLLQARPVTTLAGLPDPDGPTVLWDNSNIGESYGGVTTPLTFSFARRAYEAVYRAFCRVLRVPEAKIEDHASAFRSMVGLVRGRIYYDLLSWYEVLSLLPGFRFNRAFMEDMMGVGERLPAALLPDRADASTADRARDALHLARSALSLARQHRRLPERIRAFRTHLDRTLQEPAPGLHALRLDELAAYYRHLEDELLGRWDVPIVNDFMTMIFFGLSKRLVEAWGGAEGAQLHNDLLVTGEEMVSTEPVRRIRTMAEQAAGDEALTRTLLEADAGTAEAALAERPALHERYEDYLDRFSDRCLNELKLESPTLRDDPSPLLRAVGAMARRLAETPSEGAAVDEGALRRAAEDRMHQALRGHPVRRRLLAWVLRHARKRVADRENLRFERTRVFGTARRLFLEMGRRLVAEGVLDGARDVFYLEVDELMGFVEGTATTTDLRGLAAVRRDEFARHRDAAPPADRFVTTGAVHVGNAFEGDARKTGSEEAPEDVRRGLGCYPGTVRGPARVVRDPRGASLDGDAILVAERTDPGWIALFAACRGLVVEHGNPLSHAAVAAREMGLPAVVSVAGATHWLQDGDLVELNGRAGTVRRLGPDAS